MLAGELRLATTQIWRVEQISSRLPDFWDRLSLESRETFVVDPGWTVREAALWRAALQPRADIGPRTFAIGPASGWSPTQRAWVEMMVEEGPTRCVWLAVDAGTDFVAEILEAYDAVEKLWDLAAELPYPLDPALEHALRERSREFVFAPGAEEPFLLIACL